MPRVLARVLKLQRTITGIICHSHVFIAHSHLIAPSHAGLEWQANAIILPAVSICSIAYDLRGRR